MEDIYVQEQNIKEANQLLAYRLLISDFQLILTYIANHNTHIWLT